MKFMLAFALVVCALSGGPVNAASVRRTNVGGNNFAYYIEGQGTVFDAVQLDIVPQAGVTFINIVSGNGGPSSTGFRQPNEPFTFRNRALTADTFDGGKGYLEAPPVINPNLFSYGFTAPGSSINTATEPGGRLFLANIMTSDSAQYPTRLATVTVSLVNEGTTVQVLTYWEPEPASLSLAAMALAGLVSVSRRARLRTC